MVAICEAPDDSTLAKAILAATSQGSIVSETCRAFTEDEYRQSLLDFHKQPGFGPRFSTHPWQQKKTTTATVNPLARCITDIAPRVRRVGRAMATFEHRL